MSEFPLPEDVMAMSEEEWADLAMKANEGLLTDEEKARYASYIDAADELAILRLRADRTGRTFTIIDQFRIAAEASGLSSGSWFVLEGSFPSSEDLPVANLLVHVIEPDGKRWETRVAESAVRHRAMAIRFTSRAKNPPRLSVLKIQF